MLQTAAFRDLRNFIKKRITKAQYKVGTDWYDANIIESTVTSDGIVRIKAQIAHGSACTITGVRLLNQDGEVWATKAVSVTMETASTHLLEWFDFTVTEIES